MCTSCRMRPAVFSAIFADGTAVNLCDTCTDDLATVVQRQMVTCLIMATTDAGQEDETFGYSDPAEMVDL